MSSSQQQWNLMNELYVQNEERSSLSKEWVGVLYFLVALEIVQVSMVIGFLQAYVFSLRRLYFIHRGFINNKVSTAVHTILVLSLYLLISGTAGASGFIAMSVILGAWLVILGIIILVQKIIKSRGPGNNVVAAGGDEITHADTGNDFRRDTSAVEKSFDWNAAGESSFNMSRMSLDASSTYSKTPAEGTLRTGMNRKRLMIIMGGWTNSPNPMPLAQTIYGIVVLAFMVIVAVIFISVLFGWDVPDYWIFNGAGDAEVEYQPPLTAKSTQMIYAFPLIATKFQLQLYVKLFSEECGVAYSKSVETSVLREDWVVPYKVDMSQFLPPDLSAYKTVDDWFVRPINITLRPLPNNPLAIVAPADCRLLLFEREGDATEVYLKGYPMQINQMINGFDVSGYPNYFAKAEVAVARLAPQDYHRFHSPVAGTVVSITRLGGTYWSVNSDGVRSGNSVFLNTRTVIVLDAGPRIGFVAYIAIGATCVGSVRLDQSPIGVGSVIQRGQIIGSMHFGGSTVVMLFSRGRILFDRTILQRSRFGLETRVDVNSEIGQSR